MQRFDLPRTVLDSALLPRWSVAKIAPWWAVTKIAAWPVVEVAIPARWPVAEVTARTVLESALLPSWSVAKITPRWTIAKVFARWAIFKAARFVALAFSAWVFTAGARWRFRR